MHLTTRWWRLKRMFREGHGLRGLLNVARGALISVASRVRNYRSPFSGERVNIELMEAGDVAVALSVAHSYFDEINGIGHPPKDRYIGPLLDELIRVEDSIDARREERKKQGRPPDAVIAHNTDELLAAHGEGLLALVHCVEGGYHLGETDEHVRDAVNTLADKGVAYITLAHLYWRQVASGANALPWLTDEQYRQKYEPHEDRGLCGRARVAIETMQERKVLVDISHMSKRSIVETFDLLDDDVPVLATHAGFRFGKQQYMLDEETVREVGRRGGVIGLIFAQHQLYDGFDDAGLLKRWGIRPRDRQWEDSVNLLCAHAKEINRITRSNRNVGIGSDFDGFIKPTLAGLENMADMRRLRDALREKLPDDWEAVCSGNAMRLLTEYWVGGADE